MRPVPLNDIGLAPIVKVPVVVLTHFIPDGQGDGEGNCPLTLKLPDASMVPVASMPARWKMRLAPF